MEGFVDLCITGTVGFVKDYPPEKGKEYGSIGFIIQIPGVEYQFNKLKDNLKPSGIFVWSNYKPDDLKKAAFQQLKARLVKGSSVFIMGTIKPKEDKKTGQVSLSVDANWKKIKVEKGFPDLNEVSAFVEYVKYLGDGKMEVKYSFMNNLKKEGEKWVERTYELRLSDGALMTKPQPRDRLFIKGRISGVDLEGNKNNIIIADEVY